MKKIKYVMLFVSFVIMSSCDKISNPIIPKPLPPPPPPISHSVTKTNALYNNYRKFLLEDYTGHRCPNCPQAALIIKNTLTPRYQDTLVVVAVHAGDLSEPFGAYKTQDFRTDAGITWNGNTGFSINLWPTGMINRKNYNSNGLTMGPTKWSTVSALAVKDPFIVKLNLKTEYDTVSRVLNTYVKANFKTGYPNNTKVVVVYTQDAVVGKQDDNGKEVEEYEFEHMLRGTINGTWGTDLPLPKIPIIAKDSAEVSFSGYTIPASYAGPSGKGVTGAAVINDKNVMVIAFIYDAVTKEILQVEKVKIR
jgi:hypothetical protein